MAGISRDPAVERWRWVFNQLQFDHEHDEHDELDELDEHDEHDDHDDHDDNDGVDGACDDDPLRKVVIMLLRV